MTVPAPLTPPDCDLRGMPFMALDVVRLLDSDFFALTTGDEFKAGVALWCKSWNQLPAGSLPANDRVLAYLSGVGAAGWPSVREMALHGWIECTDGRLYHPTVAEKALEAWERRGDWNEAQENKKSRQQRWRARCRALAQRLRDAGVTPPAGAKLETLESLCRRHGVDPDETLQGAGVDAITSPGDASRDMQPSTEDASVDACEIGKTGTGTGTGIIDIGTTSLLSDQGRTEVAANDHSKPSTALTLIGEPPPPAKRGKAKAEPIAAEREHFDAFWSVYPRREGKQPALLAFVAAIRSGVAPNRIVAGAQRYAAVRQGQDPKMTKMAQGWLNERRWEDEIAEPPPSGYRDQRGGWSALDQAVEGLEWDRPEDAA